MPEVGYSIVNMAGLDDVFLYFIQSVSVNIREWIFLCVHGSVLERRCKAQRMPSEQQMRLMH